MSSYKASLLARMAKPAIPQNFNCVNENDDVTRLSYIRVVDNLVHAMRLLTNFEDQQNDLAPNEKTELLVRLNKELGKAENMRRSLMMY